jgi:hypothetical protein
MRTALALVIAISAAGCKGDKDNRSAGGAMSFDWSQRSASGTVEIRQRRDSTPSGTDVCRVQALAVPGEKALWSGTTCIPVPSALVFISRDGEKLLVLDLFPSAGVQARDWSKVSLVQLWNKGDIERHYRGAEVLAADRAADMRMSFSWLRGETYDEVRASARAVAGGTQVSVDLADGRTITLGFDAAALPTPPSVSPVARPVEVAVAPEPAHTLPAVEDSAASAASAKQDGLIDGAIYRWVDDGGEVHFTTGSVVPAKYVRRAQPIHGSVDVVSMDSPETLPQAAATGPAQPGTPAQPGAPAQPGGQAAPAPAAAPAGPTSSAN